MKEENRAKLSSVAELRKLREDIASRAERVSIWVCGGTACIAWGADAVLDAIRNCAVYMDIDLEVKMRCDKSGCNGQCERGPIVEIAPYGWVYHKVKPEDAPKILQYAVSGDPSSPTADKNPFSANQEKRVLSRMGRSSPL